MTRSGSWTLKGRLIIAFVVAGTVVATLIGSAAALLARVDRQQELVVERYFQTYRLSVEGFGSLVDADSAVRDYSLTGREEFLQPYLQLRSGSAEGQRVRTLVAEEEQISAALDRAAAAAAAWLQDYADPTVEAVRAGGPAAVTPQRLATGARLFEELRAQFRAYLDTVIEHRSAALQRLHDDLRLLQASVVAATVGALLVAGAVWFALTRWVSRPLDALGAETRVVAGGALDHEVDIAGPREIRMLAADVEGMRRRIVAQLSTVERARTEVELAREQLAEQAAALEVQAEELRRSNRDLEQFAYVASHDLQEPLRKVASFCQLLERRYKGQLDERADTYIAFAVDGATRMQALINDLLTFSRVGRVGWQPGPVALDDALARALAVLDERLEESAARVETDPLPDVVGQDTLLVQLFQNLVGNAVKFARPGVPPRIRITCERDGAQWHLAVADNGIGIEPRYADRVFVIFQRLHGREAYGGTGIGLALTKKIVEQHGGRIWIDTTRTDGTTVHFTLPVAEQSSLVGSVAHTADAPAAAPTATRENA